MSRIKYKKEVLRLLQEDDLDIVLRKIADYPPKSLLNPLFSALCHPGEKIRYHAVSCLGRTVCAIAAEDMEQARVVMRRFLWSLNDESGGIGWGCTEAMAEIMCCHKGIMEEYVHMLISYMREDGDELFQDGNYLELPMLQCGLLWGIARLCSSYRQQMVDRGVERDLANYLDSRDHTVSGLALLALVRLGAKLGPGRLKKFLCSPVELSVYDDGTFTTVTVSGLARQLLTIGAEP
ncbi:DVU0298 family protein [Desulforhopalus singaporensis]|uniref:HEAT-like repeat-containing protein n=1 Tax=Desulforhopalus singaporensis TaxID=91360 RepID=A0A1H0PDQ9_9BACT|nr:DVU0298 family protein [Desulforhopalus singaporensis]SDP02778.1 hypothetical protein SAMN05660330_01614 [Desulforhopalus singaporensis]